MNEHNCLIIRQRDTDWVLGSTSQIKFRAVTSGDWLPYTEFFERQMISDGDTNGCVLFSSQEAFDAQIENLIQLGEVPAATLSLFNELGYMDTGTDGKPHFHTSPRFLQVLTGNGFNGNSVQDAWDVMRTYGALPWTDMPVTSDLTLENYLVQPTQAQLDKAKQFLAAIGGKNAIQYHWIVNGGATDVLAMASVLPQAPLCLGVNVGPNWNVIEPPAPAIGSAPGHCVMNYMVDTTDDAFIYDHYLPNPKELVNGYPIQYVLQAVVTITPPPPAPVPPTPTYPTNPTPIQKAQWLVWLQTIATWLGLIKVENGTSPNMNPKVLGFLRGAAYAVVFAILHYAAQNLGQVLDTTTSVIVVGIVGLVDHALGDPNPLASNKPTA